MPTVTGLPLLAVLIVSTMLTAPLASAQISFDRADVESEIGTTVEPVTRQASDGQETDIMALHALVGASQTWDFTTLAFSAPTGAPVVQEYIALPDASLPGSSDPRVADATFAVKATDPAATPGDYSVTYFGLTNDQYNTYGSWAIVNGQNSDLLYDTALLSYSFPLQFGSEWEGQTTYSSSAGGFSTDITHVQEGNANGWGTLITPDGTVDALRYELDIAITTSFFGTSTTVNSTVVSFISHEGISAGITITDNPQGGQIVTASFQNNGQDGGSVDPPAAAPSAPSPANGSTVSTNPTLGWDAVNGATAYDLQVATGTFGKSTPDEVVVDEVGLTETSFQVPGLEAGMAYFWRVRGTNEGGAGDWSASFTFETEASALILPGDVSALIPADGALDIATSLEFTWTQSTDATSYDFQLATESTFAAPLTDETGIAETSFSMDGLVEASAYFWRVRGVNADGAGNWSLASFTTAAATSIERIDSEVPLTFALRGAYPNPFNPMTTIGFDLDRSSNVSLSVWDVTGRLVEHIVDQSMSAGSYTYQWNASRLSSGLYLIRLVAGDRMKMSTVTLLK